MLTFSYFGITDEDEEEPLMPDNAASHAERLAAVLKGHPLHVTILKHSGPIEEFGQRLVGEGVELEGTTIRVSLTALTLCFEAREDEPGFTPRFTFYNETRVAIHHWPRELLEEYVQVHIGWEDVSLDPAR